jgi:hypothetical protein
MGTKTKTTNRKIKSVNSNAVEATKSISDKLPKAKLEAIERLTDDYSDRIVKAISESSSKNFQSIMKFGTKGVSIFSTLGVQYLEGKLKINVWNSNSELVWLDEFNKSLVTKVKAGLKKIDTLARELDKVLSAAKKEAIEKLSPAVGLWGIVTIEVKPSKRLAKMFSGLEVIQVDLKVCKSINDEFNEDNLELVDMQGLGPVESSESDTSSS